MAVRVLVDADSCPQRVRKYLLSRAKKNQIQLYFIANKNILEGQQEAPLPDNVKMIVRPQEDQAADNWILQNAAPGDIAITRDIPLAAALLQKNVRAMNDMGKVFDKKNIERALKERELSMQMSELGLGTKRRDSYGQKEFELFAESFNKALQA
ncbi:MAG: DUF188 domain-containing protein [Treponema sp.]|nr:DUF188 domain-containing protein [Treponema sp.]